MKKLITSMLLLSGLTMVGMAAAGTSGDGLGMVDGDRESLTVAMYATASGNSQGAPMGTVTISQTLKGLQFTVNLRGLIPGRHGFHVHETGSCADMGKAAGGHFDPDGTHEHRGPQGKGHLGDLPALTIGAKGTDTESFVTPRLKSLSDIKGRSLIIHAGGDNYSDNPQLGGGGDRVACGVIPNQPEK